MAQDYRKEIIILYDLKYSFIFYFTLTYILIIFKIIMFSEQLHGTRFS